MCVAQGVATDRHSCCAHAAAVVDMLEHLLEAHKCEAPWLTAAATDQPRRGMNMTKQCLFGATAKERERSLVCFCNDLERSEA